MSIELEYKVTIFKTYFYVLKDLIKIGLIEFLPNKLLIFFYSPIMVTLFRINGYSNPGFVKEKYLSRLNNERSASILIKVKNLTLEYNESNLQKKSQEIFKTKISIRDSEENKALLIIPNGWLNSQSVEGRTQGLQIEFLIEGLRNNGFEVSIFEVLKTDFDLTPIKDNLEEFSVIFIWSLTIISPESEFYEFIKNYSKLGLIKHKIIGVITASPSQSRLVKYSKWAPILGRVIYYEEISVFRLQLQNLLDTVHVPLLQFDPKDTISSTQFSPSVHTSCLLKYNRVAWLLTLRYQCLIIGVKYHIRTMSIPLSVKKLRELYLPSEVISEQRSRYGFGFVMVHRSQTDDAHLIGSFWDYYRLGVIPIVQMQEIKPIASYMTPYLDYFPVESDLDLFTILNLGKRFPEYFEQLRKRILTRMSTEFSPEAVTRNLLSESNIIL